METFKSGEISHESIAESLLFGEVELMETQQVSVIMLISHLLVASLRRSGINGNTLCRIGNRLYFDVASLRRSGINGNGGF